MRSERVAQAISRLKIDNLESKKVFKQTIRQVVGMFLHFIRRYWFENISDQASNGQKIAYFWSIFVPVSALTSYAVIKSRRLSLFLDACSSESMRAKQKLIKLKNIWVGEVND